MLKDVSIKLCTGTQLVPFIIDNSNQILTVKVGILEQSNKGDVAVGYLPKFNSTEFHCVLSVKIK